MSDHTPGPWVAVFDENGGYDCMTDAISIRPGDTEGYQPSIVYIDCGREPSKTAARDWANANLIAAAPDLLEALKNAVETHESGSGRWLQTAYAAIAKAEAGPPNPPGKP